MCAAASPAHPQRTSDIVWAPHRSERHTGNTFQNDFVCLRQNEQVRVINHFALLIQVNTSHCNNDNDTNPGKCSVCVYFYSYLTCKALLSIIIKTELQSETVLHAYRSALRSQFIFANHKMHEAEFRNKSQLRFLQTNIMQISFCRVQVQTNITPEHSAHSVFGFLFLCTNVY